MSCLSNSVVAYGYNNGPNNGNLFFHALVNECGVPLTLNVSTYGVVNLSGAGNDNIVSYVEAQPCSPSCSGEPTSDIVIVAKSSYPPPDDGRPFLQDFQQCLSYQSVGPTYTNSGLVMVGNSCTQPVAVTWLCAGLPLLPNSTLTTHGVPYVAAGSVIQATCYDADVVRIAGSAAK